MHNYKMNQHSDKDAHEQLKKKTTFIKDQKKLKTNSFKTILGIVIVPIIRKGIKWNFIEKEKGMDMLTVYGNWLLVFSSWLLAFGF